MHLISNRTDNRNWWPSIICFSDTEERRSGKSAKYKCNFGKNLGFSEVDMSWVPGRDSSLKTAQSRFFIDIIFSQFFELCLGIVWSDWLSVGVCKCFVRHLERKRAEGRRVKFFSLSFFRIKSVVYFELKLKLQRKIRLFN